MWHIDASLLESVLDTCNLHLCYSCSSATLEHITYHIQRYNSQDFTITLQWGYPSWLLVDSFSISINNSGRATDSMQTIIVPGSQGEVNISLTYNIMHSISIAGLQLATVLVTVISPLHWTSSKVSPSVPCVNISKLYIYEHICDVAASAPISCSCCCSS